MKKKVIVWVIVLAVIGIIVGLRIKSQNKNKYTSVKIYTAAKGEVKAYLSTTAVVQSKNKEEYFAPQGKVKKVSVKVGDSVKKGDVLAQFEVQDVATGVKQSEIQYKNAVLQRQDLENQRVLIGDKINDLDTKIKNLEGSKNPQDLQTLAALKQQRESIQPISQEKIDLADNAVKLAKISLDAAKKTQAEIKDSIVASEDGVVTDISLKEGSMASNMQPAIVVQDINNLKAVAAIGKYDVNKVKLGQEVTIKTSDKQYKGKISFINPAAQKTVSQTGQDVTLAVEIDILDKAPDLKIDFETDIDILLGTASNVLKVPAEAIKTDKFGNNSVFVISGEKAEEKKVKLGLQSDAEVEIKEGLNEGEKVILNPSANLKTGTLVKDINGAESK